MLKSELVECMLAECYTKDMPEESYRKIFETLMSTPDKKILSYLQKHGFYFEKFGNQFIPVTNGYRSN